MGEFWFYTSYSPGYQADTPLGTAIRQYRAKGASRLPDGRIIVKYSNRKTGVDHGLVPYDDGTFVPDPVEQAKWKEIHEREVAQILRDETGDPWHERP